MAKATPPTARKRTAADRKLDLGPIAMNGTLVVKWISGRNGDFAVGDLHTSIGEFRVKDALLDQFDEGEYQGRFWVSQIYSKSYEYRGRITIETRASIADLQIDDEAPSSPEIDHQPEPDPIDELPSVAPAKPAAAPAPRGAAARDLSGQDLGGQDKALFGPDLYVALNEGGQIKLDPTVDRPKFREQKDRLKALGYVFDAKSQSWSPR